MPFTFAHPAIILPLLKKPYKLFSATGLVIGSIIPDFESFIRLSEHKDYSHTWLGMFWFDLPLAIIVAFIFHDIVRDSVINNLPASLQRRCMHFTGFQWNTYFRQHYIKIIFSMLIGIALHLLWDALTHLNLANPDAIDSQIYIGRFRLFKLLQNSNSIIGMLVIAIYIYYIPVKVKMQEPIGQMKFRIEVIPSKFAKLKYWALVCIVTVSAIFLIMWLITRPMTMVLFIDINISGTMVGFIVAGLVDIGKKYKGMN